MAWKNIVGTIFCSLVLATAAVGCSCGDDDGDNARIDGGDEVDGGADSGTDAPAFTSNIILVEQKAVGIPALGDGSLITIVFQAVAEAVAPTYDQMPGTPFACKAFEYTAEEFAANVGKDQGTVQLTVPDGPEYPPCTFVEGFGYQCIGTSGSDGVIAVINAEQGIFSLTDDAITFGDDEIGRFIEITGSAVAQNNGRFPIVGAAGDNTIQYRNPTPGAMAEDPTAASYKTLAGLGPSGQTDPLADDAALEVELTEGGDGDYDSFTSSVADIGDAFTLDDASTALMNDIPLDGNTFTISCSGEGGECGTSLASVLNITTTDGALPPGAPPFVMPPPETKAVVIQCIFLAPQVALPVEASAILMNSGATRIRTSYLRVVNVAVNQGPRTAAVVAGHGQTGFTTPE